MGKNYRAQLVGAFGCPIDENPTGVIMEAAFEACHLPYRYLTIQVFQEDLKQAMDAVKALQMRGINLTIPHKVNVLAYLDELSPAAKLIGAVNIVVNEQGRLWGENTDGKGLLSSLQAEGISVAGKQICVLGAGGAARAICVECALGGAAKIVVLNRNADRGQALADLIASQTQAAAAYLPWKGAAAIPEGTDILINATCVGLYPNVEEKPDLDYDTIRPGMVVSDVVFNDPYSLFLREAEARQAKIIMGIGMLVNQAALNFTYWTGEEAPKALMERVLRAEFGLK